MASSTALHHHHAPMTTMSRPSNGETLQERSKGRDVRTSNIIAAKAVAAAIRTSLGPRGMDKLMQLPSGEVLISNDGATILSRMNVLHPAAKMLDQSGHRGRRWNDERRGIGRRALGCLFGIIGQGDTSRGHRVELLQRRRGLHFGIVLEGIGSGHGRSRIADKCR